MPFFSLLAFVSIRNIILSRPAGHLSHHLSVSPCWAIHIIFYYFLMDRQVIVLTHQPSLELLELPWCVDPCEVCGRWPINASFHELSKWSLSLPDMCFWTTEDELLISTSKESSKAFLLFLLDLSVASDTVEMLQLPFVTLNFPGSNLSSLMASPLVIPFPPSALISTYFTNSVLLSCHSFPVRN